MFCLYVYATFVQFINSPKGIKTYVKQCSGSTCLPIKSMNTGGGSFVFHVPQATEMPLLVEAQKCYLPHIYGQNMDFSSLAGPSSYIKVIILIFNRYFQLAMQFGNLLYILICFFVPAIYPPTTADFARKGRCLGWATEVQRTFFGKAQGAAPGRGPEDVVLEKQCDGQDSNKNLSNSTSTTYSDNHIRTKKVFRGKRKRKTTVVVGKASFFDHKGSGQDRSTGQARSRKEETITEKKKLYCQKEIEPAIEKKEKS